MTRKTSAVDAKDVSEVDNIPFEFAAALDAGETLSSAVVTSEIFSGTDANPSALLTGSLQISGTKVIQRVTGGVAGAQYLLRCVATLSSGRVLTAAGYLPVVRL